MSALAVPALYVTILAFTALWLLHVRYEDAGLVDYYWGPGFAVIAWLELWLSGTFSASRLVFALAVSFWAVRLAVQLVRRHVEIGEEDGRYAAMRRNGGKHWWWRSLYRLFWLQAFVLWLVATPVHVVAHASGANGTGLAGLFGYAIFAAGFVIEAAADHQLARFRRERPTREAVLDTGLWARTRHPNYFGEIVLWLGLALVAFDMTGIFWAFAGPVILILVIRFISVPITEKHAASSRPGYAAYTERVSTLFPLTFGHKSAGANAPE